MSSLIQRVRAWPTTVKVPLMVAGLMIAVSALLSNQVLQRLAETQQRHLEELTGAYLDGLSSAIVPQVLREDVWEIYDQLDRTREAYLGVSALNTLVTDADGGILAASDPRLFPTQTALPSSLRDRFQGGDNLVLDETAGRAFIRRALAYQERPVGWIYAEIDIRDLLAERHEVLVALILANAALTLLFAGGGYLAVSRMLRPIGVLAEHLERGRGGRVEPIPATESGVRTNEFGHLFHRYNAMAEALNEREALAARLAEEERMASLGRLASGMAHEINNPLGGMFNAIDTIERHGENVTVRQTSLDILKRGLAGIRDVVRATLVTYKGSARERLLRSSDLDDLRFLVRQEIARRGQSLAWRNDLPPSLPLPASPVRQAVLNLLLNACAASPMQGEISFEAVVEQGRLLLAVADRGPGLPPDVATLLCSNGTANAPPSEGRGLGAWMISRLVAELGGKLRTEARVGGGTRIEITIPLLAAAEDAASCETAREDLCHVA